MKVNTKEAIKDLSGREIIDENKKSIFMGLLLSEILLAAETGSKLKFFILAQKFYNEDEVEIDEVDLKLVTEAVEQTKLYNNLINGQLLQLLEKKDKK